MAYNRFYSAAAATFACSLTCRAKATSAGESLVSLACSQSCGFSISCKADVVQVHLTQAQVNRYEDGDSQPTLEVIVLPMADSGTTHIVFTR